MNRADAACEFMAALVLAMSVFLPICLYWTGVL